MSSSDQAVRDAHPELPAALAKLAELSNSGGGREHRAKWLGPQSVAIVCQCGKRLAELRGKDGALAYVFPQRGCGVSRPDPGQRPSAVPPVAPYATPEETLLAVRWDEWLTSRWDLGCPRRGREHLKHQLHRADKLAERFQRAVRFGRTELVLGVDL